MKRYARVPFPCYNECLLFIIYPERVPKDQSSPTSAGLPGYILHPSLDHKLHLLGKLSHSIKLFSGEDLPPSLIKAISNDQVEIIDFCIDSVYQPYQLRVAKADEYCNKILETLVSRRYRLILTGDYPHTDAAFKSVFEEEDCVRAMIQLVKLKTNIQCRGTVNGTFLHLAVSKRCEPLVRLLLENGASPNTLSQDHRITPLQIYVRAYPSADSIVHLLLQHGADCNSFGSGEPPLLLALEQPNASLAAVKLLLDHGANVEAAGSDVLLKAAVRGSEFLTCILSSCPSLSDRLKRETLRLWVGSHDRSQLERKKKIVDIFLEHGFELDPEDAADPTIFYEFIKIGHLQMVERLMRWGANVRTEYSQNMCKKYNYHQKVGTNYSHYYYREGISALHVAARYAKYAGENIIRLLIDNGADINSETSDGTTALHMAVPYAKGNIIRLLLDNGADVNSEHSNGITPLYLAVLHASAAVVKCLLEHGAKIPDQQNLLRKAIQRPTQAVETVRFLLEAGANANASDECGETPFALASRYKLLKVMEELLRYGARIDCLKKRFLDAIRHNDPSVVQFYLRNGAEVELGMKEAIVTATASFHGRERILQALMEFDDPCSRTLEDMTIVERALRKTYGGKFSVWRRENIRIVLEYGFRNLRLIFASKIFEIVSRGHPAFAVLRQHVSALIAARLSINEDGNEYELPVEWRCREGDPFQGAKKDYEAEVHAMKTTNIGHSEVSFYDILNSSPPQVVCFLRDESIVETLEANNFGADFPSYSGMIHNMFLKANFRRKLAKRGMKMLDFMCGQLPELPFEVKEKIVDYLTNQNLYVSTNVLPLDEVTSQCQK